MTVPLTRDLGKFVANLRYADIPAKALPFIHTGITDCMGVMFAGAQEEGPHLLRKVLAPKGDEANLWFTKDRASAPEAACINGIAAHALDFDDVALRGHPSTVLAPAILAEAQVLHSSGQQILTAYAAGYEVWAELIRRDPEQHQTKGWHPTGIFGAVAAAAACASLHGLDEEKAAMAIAMGASQAGGLVSNFGTMCKPYHAGRSAQAGIIAARLAAAGFTASTDALEHAPGFLWAVSPGGRIDIESPTEAGVNWKLPVLGITVKKYPCCFATHCTLDGMLDLLAANKGITAKDIKHIEVGIRKRHSVVLRNHAPQTGLEAKFSMEFAMTAAVIAGRCSLPELTDQFVLREDVQALMKKVSVVPDEREAIPPPPQPIYDYVKVSLNDGRTLSSGPIKDVRGGPELPLTREELWAKFEACAEVGKAQVPVRPLFDALMALDKVKSVHDIPGLGK